MKQKLKVGITGGIGSGKTFICHILERMGYPIFFSDQVSKSLLANAPEVVSQIKALLGAEAYLENGEPDRAFIASKIFADSDLLEKVNGIMHPAVRQAFDDWADAQDARLVFNEAAILFETNGYQQLDKNILVVAPEPVRIKRVMAREPITKAAVEERMANQWTDEQKIPLADYIINNDDEAMLLPQINEILEDLDTQF